MMYVKYIIYYYKGTIYRHYIKCLYIDRERGTLVASYKGHYIQAFILSLSTSSHFMRLQISARFHLAI